MQHDSTDTHQVNSHEEQEEEAATRHKINWVHEETFKNAEEANDMLEEKKIWSKIRESEQVLGTRVDYRCNLVKKRGLQCKAAIHLLYHAEDFEVDLFVTKEEHDDDEINSSEDNFGISEKTKEAIRRYIELKVILPKSILSNLEKEKNEGNEAIKIPETKQLYNYVLNMNTYFTMKTNRL
jgi:hypothetical protein